MILQPIRSHAQFLSAIGLLGLWALVTAVSSCAESDGSSSGVDAGPTVIPPPPPAEAGVVVDAGCEAGTAGCVPSAAPCEGGWCPVTTPLDARLGLSSVWGTSKSDVWAVGSGGTILHFDGTAWKAKPSGTTEALYAIWGTGPDALWAVSSTQLILRSSGIQDGTATWTPTTPLAAKDNYSATGKLVRAVWGNATSGVVLGSESFTLDWSTPLANRWRAETSGEDVAWSAVSDCTQSWDPKTCPSVNGLWGTGPSELWAVGAAGSTSHSTSVVDGGVPTWSALDSQSTSDLLAVWGSSSGDVWMVGEHGTIRHFTSGADRLAVVASPTKEDLRGVWGSSANDVWAVGDGGTVVHFDGTAWTLAPVTFPTSDKPNLRSVWGSGSDDVWAVGDAIVLHFTGKTAGNGGGQ